MEIAASAGSGAEQADDIALRLGPVDGAIWPHLTEEAHYHGVAPMVAPVIAALAKLPGQEAPAEVRRAFLAMSGRHRAAAAARETCVDELVAVFAAAEVPLVLLKGAALAHLIYPSPDKRPSLDIDILVRPGDLLTAARIAETLGYSFNDHFESEFTPLMNHLPEGFVVRDGFRIALEIHIDVMPPTRSERLTFGDLTGDLQIVPRGPAPPGKALGPIDMLRHLSRHTFEPSQRIRLVHLFDLWRYRVAVDDDVDWAVIDARFPYIRAASDMAGLVFTARHWIENGRPITGSLPRGIGRGMLPFSGILRSSRSLSMAMGELFLPSEWWMRGSYGVPSRASLLPARLVHHPINVAKWLLSRYAARARRAIGRTEIHLRLQNGKVLKVKR